MSRIRLIFTILYINNLILETKKELRNKTNAVALIYAHACYLEFDIRFGLKAKENLYWQVATFHLVINTGRILLSESVGMPQNYLNND